MVDEKSGFRDLIAWQKAGDLASAVYLACIKLPPGHSWLSSQVLRCAVSVPANIAEGHDRGTRGELLRFLDIARGSLSELEYYLHFLQKHELISKAKLLELDGQRKESARVLLASGAHYRK